MRFDDLFSRASDDDLQRLLGTPALKLITLLDRRGVTTALLRQLITDLHSREGLLLEPNARRILFDLLRPNEIQQLFTLLDVDGGPDLYTSAKELKFRQKRQQELLFDFFEIPLPEAVSYTQPPSIGIAPAMYGLFSHQRMAAREIHQKLQTYPYRVMLHMPTGAGKTRTAMSIIADHLRASEPTLVIWLAYSEELCEQAASEFEQTWRYLGDRDVSIYRFWGSHDVEATNLHDGLFIAGLSKLYSSARSSIRLISALGSRTSLVVIDEAHSAIADTYKFLLEALTVHRPTTALLGLSATPGRTWTDIDIDRELAEFFGRQKVTLKIPGFANPVDYLVAEGYLAEVEYKSLFYESGTELSESDLQKVRTGLDIPDYILHLLAEDEVRNLNILLKVEELAKRHRRILVFAATVQHSDLLACVLRARGVHAYSVTSRTPSYERTRVIEEFKDNEDMVRVICNYGVLTTGFDAPRTSAAVVARPTKSLVLYSQMVGRAIRGVRAGGNATAEIVTVVDSNLPGFRNVAEAFINWEDVWE